MSDVVKVPFGFLLDPTSLLMFVIVATISWLVQIYSIGYMGGDPGFGRYYADLSLFALAMLTLVISSGLLAALHRLGTGGPGLVSPHRLLV